MALIQVQKDLIAEASAIPEKLQMILGAALMFGDIDTISYIATYYHDPKFLGKEIYDAMSDDLEAGVIPIYKDDLVMN